MSQSVPLEVTVTASGTGASRLYSLSSGHTGTVQLDPDTRSSSLFKAKITSPVTAWASGGRVNFKPASENDQELQTVAFSAGAPSGDSECLEKLFNGSRDSVTLKGLLHCKPK